jgi:hypothetical protein
VRLGRFYGGYRPSPKDAVGTHHFRSMRGIPSAVQAATYGLPDSVDNDWQLPLLLNQGDQGACTGFGTAELWWGCLCRAAKIAGVAMPECPSPAWNYLLGRAEDGNVNEDVGSMPSSIMVGGARTGFLPWSECPYSDAELFVPSKDEVAELERKAADQRVITGVARITSTGAAFVRDLKTALAAGYLVVFGTDVDAAFEALGSGDVWPGCKGRPLGGHCMVLTGYRTVNGRTQFRGRNSWGPDWGDNGSFWMDEAACVGFDDAWIGSAAPNYSGTV